MVLYVGWQAASHAPIEVKTAGDELGPRGVVALELGKQYLAPLFECGMSEMHSQARAQPARQAASLSNVAREDALCSQEPSERHSQPSRSCGSSPSHQTQLPSESTPSIIPRLFPFVAHASRSNQLGQCRCRCGGISATTCSKFGLQPKASQVTHHTRKSVDLTYPSHGAALQRRSNI